MRKFSFEAEPSADVMTAIGFLMPLVNNFRMEELAGQPAKPRRTRKEHASNPRIPAIIRALLLKSKPHAATKAELEIGIQEMGYSPNSVSPGLSALKKSGEVAVEGDTIRLLKVMNGTKWETIE